MRTRGSLRRLHCSDVRLIGTEKASWPRASAGSVRQCNSSASYVLLTHSVCSKRCQGKNFTFKCHRVEKTGQVSAVQWHSSIPIPALTSSNGSRQRRSTRSTRCTSTLSMARSRLSGEAPPGACACVRCAMCGWFGCSSDGGCNFWDKDSKQRLKQFVVRDHSSAMHCGTFARAHAHRTGSAVPAHARRARQRRALSKPRNIRLDSLRWGLQPWPSRRWFRAFVCSVACMGMLGLHAAQQLRERGLPRFAGVPPGDPRRRVQRVGRDIRIRGALRSAPLLCAK